MQNTIYLIDAMAFAFRAFFAIKERLTDREGRPIQAVYGFTRMLLKILRAHDPEFIAIIFDAPGETFRDKQYAAYKATRRETPPDLRAQFERMHEVARAMNLALFVVPGVEADDVIGTLAGQAEQMGLNVVIVSSDKDLMQLVTERVHMYDPGKSKDSDEVWWDPEAVRRRFGVLPEFVPNALALIGDSADNIPGVKNIGEKKAFSLLSRYQTLEGLYDHIGEIPGKDRENLLMDKDQAFFSRELATIRTDVVLDCTIEDCRRRPWNNDLVINCFRSLSFESLMRELGGEVPTSAGPNRYELVDSEEKLRGLVSELTRAGRFALDTETTDIDPMRARLVGISVCAEVGRAFYIPIIHGEQNLVSLMNGALRRPLIPEKTALDILRPLLADSNIPKIGHNLKYDIIVLRRAGIDVQGIDMDTMLASHLTEPSRLRHNLDDLSLLFFNHKKIPITDLIGKGASAITFDRVPLEQALQYACEDADMTWRLAGKMTSLLEDQGLTGMYRQLEIPLIEVLADMEMRGIAIDPKQFRMLLNELQHKLKELESHIYEQAGLTFNINSPKQLQVILFEKLGLPPARRTKQGYSTDSEVLAELVGQHPLPATLLQYRALEKLRNTYVEALPAQIHPETGRIHTSFNQTVTATGRLSSSNPNLQNIPVRTEYGRRVRQGFIAGSEGLRLISADYSQIELRVLAHLSEDTALCQAFRSGADIHAETASRVFGVSQTQVTPEMRRQAKEVNFGVIYGMSDYGLARNLGISRSAAKQFIEQYFKTYPGINTWLETTREKARAFGYVTTLLNRRRYLPDIHSSNANARNAAERVAVNTPVQGSAAEIIKTGMLNLRAPLRALGAHLLLQVHDELVVEAPAAKAEQTAALMRRVMEEAAHLHVPLKVDIGIGSNWSETH